MWKDKITLGIINTFQSLEIFNTFQSTALEQNQGSLF